MAALLRTDHIGSLIRPESLLELQKQITVGLCARSKSIPPELEREVQTEQERAVKEVVANQLKRHVVPITSGEYERLMFAEKFFESLNGYETKYLTFDHYRDGASARLILEALGFQGMESEVATGKVSFKESAYLSDWLYLRDQLPEHLWKYAKVTLPPPEWWVVQLKQPYSPELYSSVEEYLADVSAAMKKEISTLYEHGLRNVQIDDPLLIHLCDQEYVDRLATEGRDATQVLDMYIKSHKDALDGLPDNLSTSIHVCHGNATAVEADHAVAKGGYDLIAQKLFNDTPYKNFKLEFDTPRAGLYDPLKFLPVDRVVTMGLVSTKTAVIEDLEELKKKLYRAADMIAAGQGRTRADALRDNLAVSPQCGFSSVAAMKGLGMDTDNMWKKLELVRKLAEEVWAGWNQSE